MDCSTCNKFAYVSKSHTLAPFAEGDDREYFCRVNGRIAETSRGFDDASCPLLIRNLSWMFADDVDGVSLTVKPTPALDRKSACGEEGGCEKCNCGKGSSSNQGGSEVEKSDRRFNGYTDILSEQWYHNNCGTQGDKIAGDRGSDGEEQFRVTIDAAGEGQSVSVQNGYNISESGEVLPDASSDRHMASDEFIFCHEWFGD